MEVGVRAIERAERGERGEEGSLLMGFNCICR